MLERARAHRDAHTYVATNYEEFKETINTKPGFVKAMWCGNRECEDKIKEDVQATSRCMPFEQEHLSDVCVCCGKPAKKMVYWDVLINNKRDCCLFCKSVVKKGQNYFAPLCFSGQRSV